MGLRWYATISHRHAPPPILCLSLILRLLPPGQFHVIPSHCGDGLGVHYDGSKATR